MLSRNAPIIWPPTGTGTADRPMRDLEALARQIEADNPEIWTVNIIAGYSFSDVPDVGVAFSVITTGGDDTAHTALDQLEALALELKEHGLPPEWSLDDALAEAMRDPLGPQIIVEPSDNIGGGAPWRWHRRAARPARPRHHQRRRRYCRSRRRFCAGRCPQRGRPAVANRRQGEPAGS